MAQAQSLNTSIAIGDLASAAIATVGMQLVGGGLEIGALPGEFLTIGGSAVLACQVADVVHPRIMGMLQMELSDMQGKLVGAGVAAGSYVALAMLASGGPGSLSTTAIIPALVVGGACVAGRMVSERLFQAPTEPAAAE